jgi:hypothetical protein
MGARNCTDGPHLRSEAEREERLRKLTVEEAKRPFDLQRDLMIRVRLYRLARPSMR